MTEVLRFCEYAVVASGFVVVAIRNSNTFPIPLLATLGITAICYLFVLERRIDKLRVKNSPGKCTRPSSTPGLWCCCVLPIFLSIICFTGKYSSSLYNTATFLGVAISVTSVILLEDKSCTFTDVVSSTRKPFFWFPVMCQLFLMMILLPNGGIYNATSVVLCHLAFHLLMYCMMNLSKFSFSLGEANFIAQGVSVFIACIPQVILKEPDTNEVNQVVTSVVITLAGCLIFAVLLAVKPNLRSPIVFYATGASIAATFIIPLLWYHLGDNPLIWFIYYIGSSVMRIFLISSATGFTIVAFWVVSRYQTNLMDIDTVVRKYFHALALIVVVPGLMYSYSYIYLASGVALGLLSILEMMRLLKIPPFGVVVDDAFTSFVNEKDQGPLILAHIYLLVGCCLPVWLVPYADDGRATGPPLTLLSGIISVGIGDAAASVFGKLWGKYNWPGTQKTVEGTIAAIVFQFIAIQVFCCVGIPCPSPVVQLIAVILTSTLEAFTSQVDNLVLPIFMSMLLL